MLNKIWKTFQYIVWWICHEWLYDLGWFVGRITAWVQADYRLEGYENFPKGKVGMICTYNHTSQWDLVYVHNIMPRSFFTMAKVEFFDVPFFGGFVKLQGAFPVHRGKFDRKALDYTSQLVRDGHIVNIFPEGHRTPDFTLQKAYSGTALVAYNADALIVPVAITGTEYLTRLKVKGQPKPKITVRVGQPYKLPRGEDRPDLDELTELMMVKIAELLPPEKQGYYAPELVAERKTEREAAKLAKADRRAARKKTTS